MVNPAYVPGLGDMVWLEFDPQAGHEQAGRRPALVLSPLRYNAMRGMMICCPMTSRIKGYVFEVVVSRDPPSVVLADQVKSLDWRAPRPAHRHDRAGGLGGRSGQVEGPSPVVTGFGDALLSVYSQPARRNRQKSVPAMPKMRQSTAG